MAIVDDGIKYEKIKRYQEDEFLSLFDSLFDSCKHQIKEMCYKPTEEKAKEVI